MTVLNASCSFSAAVTSMAKFGASCSELTPSILVLLDRYCHPLPLLPPLSLILLHVAIPTSTHRIPTCVHVHLTVCTSHCMYLCLFLLLPLSLLPPSPQSPNLPSPPPSRCLLDSDDEVRDRALLYIEVLKQNQKALSSAYILNREFPYFDSRENCV